MIKRPMLAGKADLRTLKYPALCTPKLDGIRALRLGGKLVSRNFKPIPNREVQEYFSDLPEGCDGELIIPSLSFNVTASAVMGEYNDASKVEYWIFDYIGEDLKCPYTERISNLKQTGLQHRDRTVLLGYAMIDDEQDLLSYENSVLKEGFEGIMIRSSNGPYKEGRSTTREGYLLKLKRFEDGEAIILEFEQRMTNLNEQTRDAFGLAKRSSHQAGLQPMDMLGALVVQDVETGVTFSLGSGFDEAQRKEIWASQEIYRGKIVKYKWQEHGSVDRPRFPIFLGFRT